MKRKRIIRLTEQDLEKIISSILGSAGMSPKDLFGVEDSKEKEEKTTDNSEKNKDNKLDSKDSDKKTFPKNTQSLVDSKFPEFTKKIIENLEGGYYHPNFKKTGAKSTSGGSMSPSKFTAMLDSGETMFGIDRKHGGSINTTSAGQKFWSIIDSLDAKNNWPYNYKGGKYQSELVPLVSEMMKPQYQKNASNYLNKDAKKIVESDESLLFNFVYGSWNGPGWFKKFASVVNSMVDKGIYDPKTLNDAVNQRRKNDSNSLIANGGKKVERVTDSLA